MLSENRQTLYKRLGGMMLIAGLGALLVTTPLGDGLARLSYDLPFLFRSDIGVPEVAIVYVDRASLEELGQKEWPPDRRIYARLLQRLKAEGARLVVFDILFRTDKPDADPEFAAAIREHGNVVLGGVFESSRLQRRGSAGVALGEFKAPNETLRSAARAWGLLTVRPLDYTFGARRIFTGMNDIEAAIWTAARLAEAPVTKLPPAPDVKRWLNFYGSGRSLDALTLAQVVQTNVPPDFLRGRVVFVGADPSVTPVTGERDVFTTPYSRFSSGGEAAHAPGVEVLATGCANLLRGDWIKPAPRLWQGGFALLWGVLLLLLPRYFRVRGVIGLTVLGMGGLLLLGVWEQLDDQHWWNWAALVLVQAPLALVWIIGMKLGPTVAFISYRRRDGDAYAQAILSGLRTRGLDAYLDVNFLGGGTFPVAIERHIEKAPNFVLIVSPSTFAPERINKPDDWMRLEIAHALRHKRNIIPMFVGGAGFPDKKDLPEDIAAVADFHGITYHHAEMDLTLDKLSAFCFAKPQRVRL